jgi:CBS domain-containing protein
MSIESICVREVDTATPDDSIIVAAERMHDRAVGTLVVVTHTQHVIGNVTDRDLVARVIAKGRSPEKTTVRDVMTLGPKTISENSPIESALLIMRSGKFRRLPVVDRNHTLVGLVTLDDVLMLLAEEFTQIGRLLKRETPRAIMEDPDSLPGGITRLQSEAGLEIGD